MSPNSPRFALPFGLVCFAAAALAQQPYNWVNNPPGEKGGTVKAAVP
jgi:hypothetical protein